ncbi:MAG TPA: PHP domain-containing protein, partial [Clostridia bacterium]|nr:PHP domain-containing protein [Clostridia bacterium]
MENLYSKYKIIADYHTHTTYSHGKGSIEDNVKKSINKGLKTIAITDHGSKHFIFGVSEKNLLKQKEEINTILQKYPDFQLLFGVESNITGIDGGYDITTGFENNFDIILCGF